MKIYKDGKYEHKVNVTHRDNKIWDTNDCTILIIKSSINLNGKKYQAINRADYNKPVKRTQALEYAIKENKKALDKYD